MFNIRNIKKPIATAYKHLHPYPSNFQPWCAILTVDKFSLPHMQLFTKEWNQLLRDEKFPYRKNDYKLHKHRQAVQVQVSHHNFILY